MSYAGTAHGGIIELEDGVELPEGTRVRITPVDEPATPPRQLTLSEWLEDARRFRQTLPMTSDSVEILRQIRAERANR